MLRSVADKIFLCKVEHKGSVAHAGTLLFWEELFVTLKMREK